MNHTRTRSALAGAAFLMATAAVGPGFITQTTVFTEKLFGSFGFVILCSIILDIAIQLNIWRIVSVSGSRAQDIANKIVPGAGFFLATLIVLGGLAFNVGNIGGAGLGMNLIFGLDANHNHPIISSLISTGIALFIFWVKDAGNAMDLFAKLLGFVMIALTLLVAIKSQPPLLDAAQHSFFPEKIDTVAILTLVGGTVGGYISFAGAHRLLDAGWQGIDQVKQVSRSSVKAIILASSMRILLFLAALGVVAGGASLDPANPAASVFSMATGAAGKIIFGIVLWCAAITSVVGAAYTSVSFLRTFHPWLDTNFRIITTLFILVSCFVYGWVENTAQMLVFVGTLNGLILPVSLSLMLLATHKKNIVGAYRHPRWLLILGWLVTCIMTWICVKTIINYF